MASNDSMGPEDLSGENSTFIRETVVKKPKKKLWKKLLLTVFLAVVFGAVAAVTFYFAGRFLGGYETTEALGSVSFPSDEDPRMTTEATTPENTAEETLPAQTGDETASAESTESSAPDADTELPETTAADYRAVFESLQAEHTLSLADYKQLYKAADVLISRVGRSIVKVVASNVMTDWFSSEYSFNTETFGVIVAVTGQEVLILTPEDAIAQISENSSLTVTFGNSTAAGAYIKATDTVTGLAVIAVSTDNVSNATRGYIEVVNLGNSFVCSLGQPVIAMGAPAGFVRSVSYGSLTYIESDVSAVDTSYSVLHTDITGDENSRGFLIDFDGNLIGWIMENSMQSSRLDAIGISGIKNYIENLSNGIPIGYLGVVGQTVPASKAEELGMPGGGLYVVSCEEDSPAVKAGVQSGDVIIGLAGSSVTSVKMLRDSLLGMNTEQTVKLTVLRKAGSNYKELTFDVRIERR